MISTPITSTSPSIDHALTILTGIFLLFPLVAIFMQTMIRFYLENEPGETNWERQRVLNTSFWGYVFIFLGGLISLIFLYGKVDILLIVGAGLSLIGLSSFGVALYLLKNHVLTVIEERDGGE